ncbi:MAG: response regulator [Pseudomonadota bacterium]
MGDRPHILIIDDDRDLVNSIGIILESQDYETSAAYNGKEGFTKIQERIPDLIILDVMMATDTEGFDLAFKLQRNPEYSGIPILMVTALPQKMVEMGPEKFQHILGENWPVTEFLEKPIDPERLLAAAKTLLQK